MNQVVIEGQATTGKGRSFLLYGGGDDWSLLIFPADADEGTGVRANYHAYASSTARELVGLCRDANDAEAPALQKLVAGLLAAVNPTP